MPLLLNRNVVSALLAVPLMACGSSETDPTGSPSPQGTPSPSQVPTQAPTSAATQEPEPTAEPTPAPTNGPEPTAAPTEEPATPTAAPSPSETPAPPPAVALGAQVEVKFDEWGIPHIYGQTVHDVVFAQGYVGASQRLWQMDYLRRMGRGQLAEILGEPFLEEDIFARAFDFGGLAERITQKLPTEDAEVYDLLAAYVSGVNAYLDDALEGRNGATLPPQIVALGYVPDLWQVSDVLVFDKLQTYSLSGHHSHELGISLAADFLVSEDAALDLIREAPIDPAAVVPGYFDDRLPPESTRTLSIEEQRAAIRARRARMPAGVARESVWAALQTLEDVQLPWEGSNNWSISGEHTESGFPMVAGDTHEGVEAPPTYWQVHLSSADGELEVMGYSFAGAPLIAFGHNDVAAWSPTTNYIDVSDIFQETYNPVNDTVMSNGRPVKVESRDVEILVRPAGGEVGDAAPRPFTFKKVPHHGPIYPPELLGGLPLTLSAAWTGWQERTALRFLWQVNTMKSFEDLRAAQRTMPAGAVNLVYADVGGDIGYSARVDVPVRSQLDPANPPWMILPGGGDYDWTEEIYPDEDIPWAYNPEVGFVTSANNDVVGNTFDGDPLNDPVYISAVYDSGTRAWQITERLQAFISGQDLISEQDSASVQADTFSRLAERTLPYLLAAGRTEGVELSEAQSQALELLGAWDRHCTGDSAATLLFHGWLLHAMKEVFGDETDPAFFNDLSGDYVHIFARDLIYCLDATAEEIERYADCSVPFPIESGTNYFDDKKTEGLCETRDDILLRALALAVSELQGMYGQDLASWRWDGAHQMTFVDDAAPWIPEASTGPYPVDGGMFTVDVADFRMTRGGALVKPFEVNNGPSQRFITVLDPAGIRTWAVNAGGQSERPQDEHFFDQIELYLGNEYYALPFAAEDVELATQERWTLPAGFPLEGSLLAE